MSLNVLISLFDKEGLKSRKIFDELSQHLISRDYNAIKSMTYVMLIAAMFMALFNKLNNRTGFKLSKLALIYELEIELVKELVILCKGDPNLLNQYLAGFGQ